MRSLLSCRSVQAARTPGFRLVFAAACVLAAGVANATVVCCVSSSQEIQNALAKASDGGVNNGKDNHIHIVRGTYGTAAKTPSGSFEYDNFAGEFEPSARSDATRGAAPVRAAAYPEDQS